MKKDNWISKETLCQLFEDKNPESLKQFGGKDGILTKLDTTLTDGLTLRDVEERIQFYGSNVIPEPESRSFFDFVWDALQDQTLIVLMVAAATEIAVGIYQAIRVNDKMELLDGCCIIVAILIVVTIGSTSDYQKQIQFKKLNSFGKSQKSLTVVRNGANIQIPQDRLLVGDILIIQTGLVIPADGVLLEGFQVQVDESTMTGESHMIDKDLERDFFLLSGTNIVNGVGKMIVLAVGLDSLFGKSLQSLEVPAEETPLQQKLSKLADSIANVAIYLAVSMTLLLTVVYFISNSTLPDSVTVTQDLINLVILAITIVVVAVPEGLPLAVTLSLAHATVQMLKDNNLVRNLASCETMGNATTICSDKTGTLTLNKMTVVQGIVAAEQFSQDANKTPSNLKNTVEADLLKFTCSSLNINSTAAESRTKEGEIIMEGSKTEIALLHFTESLGFKYVSDREQSTILDLFPFSSETKRMSCKIELNISESLATKLNIKLSSTSTTQVLFVKGASEVVLKDCTFGVDNEGNIIPITQALRSSYENLITKYAKDALRTIAAAYSSENSNDLVLLGIFGIQDPLRDEVPLAVANCQSAGVVVRMVTGDSAPTARAIARGCGILTADGLVMEGPEFRKLSETEMNSIIPRLQVLARSSPLDKQILVQNLKRLGETVAVTGDGTNDAPALAAADVGFSMGIAGTEVAKEASDIILMDDNFASIVKAVLWGRCVYDAIRKFLQFQLSVNVSAVVITIVTSIYTTVQGPKKPESVLTAVQLLWVNLIMDTMAALALATDDPTPELLQRKPEGRSDSLVNHVMSKQIVGQALFQCLVCLILYFNGPTWFPDSRTGHDVPAGGYVTATIVFNTFIFCQLFNEVNCRSITDDVNIFKGLSKNKTFMAIFVITLIGQIFLVQVGGIVFSLDPNGLSFDHWILCIVLGSGSIWVGMFIRLCSSFFSVAQTRQTKSHVKMESTEDAPVRNSEVIRRPRSTSVYLSDPRATRVAMIENALNRRGSQKNLAN